MAKKNNNIIQMLLDKKRKEVLEHMSAIIDPKSGKVLFADDFLKRNLK